MIVFEETRDRELLAELKEAGLVTPITLEAICARLASWEDPGLSEFLLAGAELIDEANWLTWMIRRHGCYRFGPVKLAADFGSERWQAVASGELPPVSHHPNLPYALLPVPASGRPACLVAVLRPDYPVSGLPAAATLTEIRELRRRWSATSGRAGPSPFSVQEAGCD
jgi:hypothetical protein